MSRLVLRSPKIYKHGFFVFRPNDEGVLGHAALHQNPKIHMKLNSSHSNQILNSTRTTLLNQDRMASADDAFTTSSPGSFSDLSTAPETTRSNSASAELAAQDIHQAVQGLGTDEAAVRKILRQQNPTQNHDTMKAYAQLYNEDMRTRLGEELSGTDLTLVKNTFDYARPSNDAEQGLAYDKALCMKGATPEKAWRVVTKVGYRQKIDALGEQITRLQSTHPEQAKALKKEHHVAVLALISSEVYLEPSVSELLPKGFSRVTNPQELAEAGLTPAMLVNEQSGYKAVLYKNQTDNTYVYVNCGSNESVDYEESFTQGPGLSGAQYKQALNNAQQISSSAIGQKVTFSGHSLGGGLASAQSFATGIAGVTFGAAGLNKATLDKMGVERMVHSPELVEAYHLQGDLLAMIQDNSALLIGGLGSSIFGPAGVVIGAYEGNKVPKAGGLRIEETAIAKPTYKDGSWQHNQQPLSLEQRSSQPAKLHSIDQMLNSLVWRLEQIAAG
jgi:hypothetical protein